MVETPLPAPGTTIAGKYRIDSTIGQGGMGVVLGAFDLSLGRPVAIKFLSPERAANEAAATRFAREARSAAAIQSEHVVRVHEVGALPSGAPFIVMEHLRGSDLAAVVQARGGLPVDFAVDLVLQASEALAQAHALGIVHRDLKPQNLFLTERGDGSPCVKVLDFGISKVADTDESSPKLTSTEMVMGTPLYMSPEQVRSLKNVDARADIWALGVILFELLAAKPPFDGPSASALHAAIAMDPPASLRERRPDLPQHIEAAVMRALEKDPARRFQTVQELAAAIAPFATERGRQTASTLTSRVASAPQIISLPPPAMTPRHDSGMAGMANIGNASTMDVKSSWQTATSPTPPASATKSNVGLIIGLAAGGLLVTLLAVGGTAAYFMTKAKARETVVVQANGPTPTPTAPAAPAITSEPAVQTASTAAAPSPAPAPAPAPKKDAGPPKPTRDDEERALAASAQSNCNHQHTMMTMFKDPMGQKRQAELAKASMCHMNPSIRCERQVCREACFALNDEMCKQNLDFWDKSNPPKY